MYLTRISGIISVLFSVLSYGATYTVLMKSGNVQLYFSSNKTWKQINLGQQFDSKDSLKLSDQSFICGYNSDGQSFERWGKSDKIIADNLITNSQKNRLLLPAVADRYTQKIISSFSKNCHYLFLYPNYHEMGPLQLYAPLKDTAISDSYLLYYSPQFNPHEILVLNYFEEELSRVTPTTDSVSRISIALNEKTIRIRAIKDDSFNGTAEVTVIVKDPLEKKPILTKMDQIFSNFNSESISDRLLLAAFYEEERCYNEALKIYFELRTQHVENEELLKYLNAFLVRQSLARCNR